MPGDFWEDMASEGDFSWDEVDGLRVVRGDDGWDVYVESDGEMIPVAEGLDDQEMEDYFWDDLYYWAEDNDIDVDREIAYAPE